jgi:hypothetical protein
MSMRRMVVRRPVARTSRVTGDAYLRVRHGENIGEPRNEASTVLRVSEAAGSFAIPPEETDLDEEDGGGGSRRNSIASKIRPDECQGKCFPDEECQRKCRPDRVPDAAVKALNIT